MKTTIRIHYRAGKGYVDIVGDRIVQATDAVHVIRDSEHESTMVALFPLDEVRGVYFTEVEGDDSGAK